MLHQRQRARLHRLPHETPLHVIVHQAHRLHEGVDGRGAHEGPPAALQVFRERRRRGRRAHRHQRRAGDAPRARDAGSGCQRQKYAASEPHSADELACAPRVVDSRLDLAAVPDDGRRPRAASSTRRGVKRATRSKSNPANARRNASRLRRMVSQLRPAWKPSRQIFSNSRRSSVVGRPHSVVVVRAIFLAAQAPPAARQTVRARHEAGWHIGHRAGHDTRVGASPPAAAPRTSTEAARGAQTDPVRSPSALRSPRAPPGQGVQARPGNAQGLRRRRL